MTQVVIDIASGQDQGREAIQAAALASLELPVELVLVGDESQITAALAGLAHDAERLRVVHAPGRIDPQLPARTALEQSPQSSLAVGLGVLLERADSAFVSAGHPGAIVLEATRRLTPLPGLRRAALAAVYPTLRYRGTTNDPFALLLDIGATINAGPTELVQFAVMGAAYARRISANDRPRVALLSNSPVADGAPPAVREAHQLLSGGPWDFDYIGPLRADQLTLGESDVVVSDGFVGDIVVRTLEGVAATAQALLARAGERFSWRLGVSILGDGLERLRELVDWENYGGAPLLGFHRPVIITQQNSHRRALLNAIRLAAKVSRLGVLGDLERALARWAPPAGASHG